jgi:hypothetical protein
MRRSDSSLHQVENGYGSRIPCPYDISLSEPQREQTELYATTPSASRDHDYTVKMGNSQTTKPGIVYPWPERNNPEPSIGWRRRYNKAERRRRSKERSILRVPFQLDFLLDDRVDVQETDFEG